MSGALCIAGLSALIINKHHKQTLTLTVRHTERQTAQYFATTLQNNLIITIPCASNCISVNSISEIQSKVMILTSAFLHCFLFLFPDFVLLQGLTLDLIS